MRESNDKDVVRHQASPGQHLNREEIGSSQYVHMPADEILPRGRLAPFGRRCDVVAAQDVAFPPRVLPGGGQVLILQQQLLIDEARHKGQKACPMEGGAHVEGSS